LLVSLVPLYARSADAAGTTPAAAASPARALRIEYQGWSGSVLLSNGVVEAVIVPAVGRVMQFRFAGAENGPFWEDPARRGQRPDPAATEWANFGGDKAWPSPQADWPRLISRPWPPPAGFDSMTMEAVIDGPAVTLISQIDPDYGVRVRRRIELTPGRPVMTITTRYEKVSGRPVAIGVWTITQVKDPVAVYAVLPDPPRSGAVYVRLSEELPANLKVANGLVALTRAPHKNRMIGVRAATLVWIGGSELLRIDAALAPGARYADQESSAQIYTNEDPLAYVELEMLSPVEKLAVGGHLERQSIYTLAHRTENDPAMEIKRLLAR
jgi:hypothetical protein